jgi:hypothetical protein
VGCANRYSEECFYRVGEGARIYKIKILPVVLYGCKTWSLTLAEEHTLRVFENRVLRGIFGPKTDEVIGGWRSFITCTLHEV